MYWRVSSRTHTIGYDEAKRTNMKCQCEALVRVVLVVLGLNHECTLHGPQSKSADRLSSLVVAKHTNQRIASKLHNDSWT